MPHNSAWNLVFRHQRSWWNSNGRYTTYSGDNTREVWNFCDFWPVCHHSSEMIRRKTITMECKYEVTCSTHEAHLSQRNRVTYSNTVNWCTCVRKIAFWRSASSAWPSTELPLFDRSYITFLQRAQCSHCKRCISYGNSVCPSIRLSVRHTPVLCQNDGT